MESTINTIIRKVLMELRERITPSVPNYLRFTEIHNNDYANITQFTIIYRYTPLTISPICVQISNHGELAIEGVYNRWTFNLADPQVIDKALAALEISISLYRGRYIEQII